MLVDLHVHSTASDGTLSPEEIAVRAKDFVAIALTDHDNCDGIGKWGGIAGIELSIDAGKGFDRFHLLGLGIDVNCPQLKLFLQRILDGRNERNAQIIANFERLGIELGEEIGAYAHGEVLARPHFAAWLVDHGIVGSVREAFDKYLLASSPKATRCYEERYHPSQEKSFEVVHAAGGLAIMAHPRYWRDEWRIAGRDYAMAETELKRLKDVGLDGIEAIYQANSMEDNIEFTRIADKVGLIKTAGSDFHGATKPEITLGMNVPEKFIAPFLSRISAI